MPLSPVLLNKILPCPHPTVLKHHGWIVEADARKEKDMRKSKKKNTNVIEEDEIESKKYYCMCLTV